MAFRIRQRFALIDKSIGSICVDRFELSLFGDEYCWMAGLGSVGDILYIKYGGINAGGIDGGTKWFK